MKLSKPEAEAIKDLLRSEGWKMIVKGMMERRAALVNLLTTSNDFQKIQKQQAQISEIDFLIKAPHQWIK